MRPEDIRTHVVLMCIRTVFVMNHIMTHHGPERHQDGHEAVHDIWWCVHNMGTCGCPDVVHDQPIPNKVVELLRNVNGTHW